MAAQETFINSLLNAAFKGGTYTGGTIKMALFRTGLPSGSGVEASGGGYARQTLSFSSPSAKSIITSANATFSDLVTSQTLVAFGIYDGTTLIDEGTLASPFTPDITNNELQISYRFNMTGL